MADWFRFEADGTLVLRVRVQPGARRTEAAGLHGGCVKIRVAAPALEERANEALVEFVARAFGVPRRQVALAAGARSREKRLEIRGARLEPGQALGVEA